MFKLKRIEVILNLSYYCPNIWYRFLLCFLCLCEWLYVSQKLTYKINVSINILKNALCILTIWCCFLFFAIQLIDAKGRLYPVTYIYSDNTSHIKIQLQCYIIYIKEFSQEHSIILDNFSAHLNFEYGSCIFFLLVMQIDFENDDVCKNLNFNCFLFVFGNIQNYYDIIFATIFNWS